MNILANNEQVSMTRRFPNLPQKVLRRDSEIVKKIMFAWDLEHNKEKVLSIYLKEHKNLSDERYWELMLTLNVDIMKVKTYCFVCSDRYSMPSVHFSVKTPCCNTRLTVIN